MENDLTEAARTSWLVVDKLQDALRKADDVETILLLGLIEAAVKLNTEIERFMEAKKQR